MAPLGSLPRSFHFGAEEVIDRGSRPPESSFKMLDSRAASALKGGGDAAVLGRRGRVL